MKNQFWANLNSIDKAKEFADMAAAVHGEVDVRSGRYVVDGKSLLGLFSLDLSQPVQVIVHAGGEELEELSRRCLHLMVDPEAEAQVRQALEGEED